MPFQNDPRIDISIQPRGDYNPKNGLPSNYTTSASSLGSIEFLKDPNSHIAESSEKSEKTIIKIAFLDNTNHINGMPSDSNFNYKGFSEIPEIQKQLIINSALKTWENSANIKFIVSEFNDADIFFAGFDGVLTGSNNKGDAVTIYDNSINKYGIWIDYTKASFFDENILLSDNSPLKYTAAHEVAHALGMRHPSDYNAQDLPSDFSYENYAKYLEDNQGFTVASYFGPKNGSYFGESEFKLKNSDYNLKFNNVPSTAMIDDINFVEWKFGKISENDTSVFSFGNTTYGFNSNLTASSGILNEKVDIVSAFIADNSNDQLIFTVSDKNGFDTFNFSGYSESQYINLSPGGKSDVGSLKGNVTISDGTIIEAAIGGSGDDIFLTNNANNVIIGGLGNNTAYLPNGSEILYTSKSGSRVDLFIRSSAGIEHDVFFDISNFFETSVGKIDIESHIKSNPSWTEFTYNYGNRSPWDPVSPLILDLDGDGVETISLSSSTAFFDLYSNNFSVKTGWVGKDDGLLALDKNENEKIDNISELFGNKTENGFTLLSAYDSNSDGVINSQDQIFEKLRIWKDVNSDGVSSPDELKSLSEIGVVSISLNAQNLSGTNNGNILSHRSSFSWANGLSGVVDDIWFQNSQLLSYQKLPDSYAPSSDALSLPFLSSYGNLNDFTFRIDSDPVFKQMVTDAAISANSSMSQFEQSFENVLMRWASVSSIQNTPSGISLNTSQFAVLKALYGGVNYGTDPGQSNISYLNAQYASVLQSMAGKFLIESARYLDNSEKSPVLSVFSELMFDGSSDKIIGDIGAAMTKLGELSQNPENREDAMRAARMLILSVSASDPNKNVYISNALNASHMTGGDLTEFNAMLKSNSVIRYDDPTRDGISFGSNLIYGTSSGESLNGFTSNDTFISNGGLDSMYGGSGNDSYIYKYSDGSINISEFKSTSVSSGGIDTLYIKGISPDDIILSPKNKDIDILIGQNVISLKNILNDSDNVIEYIKFDDGTSWSYDFILSKIMSFTNNSDNIYGDWKDNIIQGGLGNDVIFGNGGNDIITGGPGDDIINGGEGTDSFVYGRGDGIDTFLSSGNTYNLNSSDKIIFKEGINPEDVLISQNNSMTDLIISINDGGKIIIKNYIDIIENRIASINFSNGTIWNASDILQKSMIGSSSDDIIKGSTSADTIKGFDGNDYIDGQIGYDFITGGTGDDIIKTGPGNDTVYYGIGDGNDTIFNEGGLFGYTTYQPGSDTIVFNEGIALSSLSFKQDSSGKDLIVFVGESGSVALKNGINNASLFSFKLNDGTVISGSSAVSSSMIGTNSSDTIFGSALADYISGNGGDDILMGSGGGDTYFYKTGDGNDTIKEWATSSQSTDGTDIILFGEGISSSQVRFTGGDTSYDMVALLPDGSKITIANALYSSTGVGYGAIEQYKFNDGTIISGASAKTAARSGSIFDDVLWGSSAADTINGLSGNDIIHGLLGNDNISGGAGNDKIFGEGGNDFINADTGDDMIDGGAGFDSIIFSGRLKEDFTINTLNGSVSIFDNKSGSSNLGTDNIAGIENLVFSNGSSSIVSPIILDMNGDGIELVSKELSNTYFDFDEDGICDKTGWISSGDAFLVFDQNQNRLVDGVGEISFSNVDAAKSDLDGLRMLHDKNGDGVIDINDEDFDKFGIWQDINSNGQQDSFEFKSLSEAGISSINLQSNSVNRQWEIGENIVIGVGSFTMNGSEHSFLDAAFSYESTYAENHLSISATDLFYTGEIII